MKNWIILLLSLILVVIGYHHLTDETHKIDQHAVAHNENIAHQTSPSKNIVQRQIANSESDSLTAKLDTHHDKRSDDHSHIPSDIKADLCTEKSEEHSCIINLDKNYKKHLVTGDGQLKQSEIAVVLASVNFDEVMDQIANSKTENHAFVRENKYIDLINTITNEVDGIASNKLACDETLCALSVSALNESSWAQFSKKFFSSYGGNGNIFIQKSDYQQKGLDTRVMFFPDNNNAVVRRL